MPHRALAVANHFLDLGKKDKVEIDPMKLQKLIYFAHGWYLALADGPLIQEHVEAWNYGPVIPAVYHKFKKFGRHPITERAQRIFVNLEAGEVEIEEYKLDSDPDVESLLKRVWDVYGRLSGTQLSNMTHDRNGAWYRTYHELGGEGRRGTDIPDELIKEEFVEKAGRARQPA